ncbi:MAG: rhodanese-like domain-containing protein [Planctomycetes bacterium]|nr:rhodanese-like domain-containing protein [Planctomycetota bacterium]HPF13951.1 rhodanese-like domain-containing protein [Planctomycetota bacterium]HRV80056.1 rhodanese-like domain-containing protein [Planctomycetota bacterium]
MSDLTITPDMTMEAILQVAPAAQRALFQRYHVGGCSSCGFQPEDTLAQVAKDHNILDIKDMIRTIVTAQELDSKNQVEPDQVRAWLSAGEDFSFLDVRLPEERTSGLIEGAELLDYNDAGKYMGLPKERRIVFFCQDGTRSLDVASYFIGHKFTNVWCVRGGAAAW